ncbi:hypothetical protein B0J18DRAFT_164017 [Chaetomium sp. MPI-SDFR-AT-0129]|nr:hypothetical protein B0J18DRAFT_164017 [Chaetomium sp. MPI-SDFR-AT-0129]
MLTVLSRRLQRQIRLITPSRRTLFFYVALGNRWPRAGTDRRSLGGMGISQPYEQWTGSWDHGLFWRFGERTGGKEENKTLQTESRFSPPSTRIKGLAGQVARLPSCDADMDNYFEDFGDTTSSQVFCSLACGGLSWLWLRIAAPVSASWGKTRHVLKVSEDSFIASLLSLVFHSSATCLVLIATLRSPYRPG